MSVEVTLCPPVTMMHSIPFVEGVDDMMMIVRLTIINNDLYICINDTLKEVA